MKICCNFATNLQQMGNEDKLVGREREWEELEWAVSSHRSEFIVMYGRRRVGKTFLVRRFFNDTYSFHYVGAHRQKKTVQLQNFREALARYSGDKSIPELKSWHDAFLQLAEYLEKCKEKRKIVFFDEMPWIDTQGSEFVDELEYFWSNWVQNRDDIVFVACGSATSWMKDKLEDNQGGLHNRITHRIYLRPFFLSECKAYLIEHGFDWDDYQILQCYMLFGGVPYYLSLLRPSLSLPQNVDSLVFRRGGDLSDEFNELYNALFNKANRYIAIVKLLSTKGKASQGTRLSRALATVVAGSPKCLIIWSAAISSFLMPNSATRPNIHSTAWQTSIPYSIFAMSKATARATNIIGSIITPTVAWHHGKASLSRKSACVICLISRRGWGFLAWQPRHPRGALCLKKTTREKGHKSTSSSNGLTKSSILSR